MGSFTAKYIKVYASRNRKSVPSTLSSTSRSNATSSHLIEARPMLDPALRPAGVLGDLLPGDQNDACCWACSGGGDVVCCDGCRAVYHLACINLESLSEEEDWFCPLCSCKECQAPCKTLHPALCIQTELLEVHTKTPLPPRQSPQAKLPDGPEGYVCPQQLRLWLQQQPTADLEADTQQQQPPQVQESGTGVTDKAADGPADHEQLEPRPKRQKRDPVVSSSSSSTPAPPQPAADNAAVAGSDTYVRCCCCQRCCHVSCLSPEQQQHLAAWASDPTDCSDRDQQKNTRNTRRIRSPRGKKQQAKQDQAEQQQQQAARLLKPVQPFFCSPGCKQTATELAKCCARGVVQLDALADGTPVCWQLIQPAAVAAALTASTPTAATSSAAAGAAADAATAAAAAASASEKAASEARSTLAGVFAGAGTAPAAVPACALLGSGVAPAYTQQQALVLAQVLRDAQQLMSQQLGPAWEVRTYQHTLTWMLSGLRQVTPGGMLDLSHFHVAVLWVGSTLASVALLRVHGGEAGGLLEVSLAATSQQLQNRRLGRLLLAAVERFASESCKVKQAWMPALGGVVRPRVGVSVLPAWQHPEGGRDRLALAPGCSTKLLGLAVSGGSSAGALAAGGSRGQAVEDAAQRVPKGVAACWALKLKYGRAANVTDWLQLTKCPLLRYSYVPFVSKRLEPHTLLQVPSFRRQQPARPPPLPPLPPQMPLQPRFAMPQLLPPPYLMQQRPLLLMQQLGPQPHVQQQVMVPLGVAAGAASAAAAVSAGGGAAGGAGPAAPQGPAVMESQQHPGPAAISGGPAADSGSSLQQQVPSGSDVPQADVPQATPSGAPQQQQQQQVPSIQQQRAPAAPAPASKRQQWKEQVMRQFLAQQQAATHKQQASGETTPAVPAPAEPAQAAPAPPAEPAPYHQPAAGDTPMEDAQQ